MSSSTISTPSYITTAPTRLRQLALITPSPLFARTKHLLTHIFDVSTTFVDTAVNQWGIENILVPLGGDLLEVCTPLPSHWDSSGDSETANQQKRLSTPVGRLLEKRRHASASSSSSSSSTSTGGGPGKSNEGLGHHGEGGYMIIMQCLNALARRREIEGGLRGKKSKVIFSHSFSFSYPFPPWNGAKDKGYCIQYHPSGVPGGMMPELDSHTPSPWNPAPLETRFSPWHALGPDLGAYTKGMRDAGGLWLLEVELRLAEGKGGREAVAEAVAVWSETFGIPRSKVIAMDGGEEEELEFTNARMRFVPGERGKQEGLVSITIGVQGREKLKGMAERAKGEGVWKHADGADGELSATETVRGRERAAGRIEMVGIRWYLVLMGEKAEVAGGYDQGNGEKAKARL